MSARKKLLALFLTAGTLALTACSGIGGGPTYSTDELLRELRFSGVDCEDANIETTSLAEKYNPIDFDEGEELSEIQCYVAGGRLQIDVASSQNAFEAYRGVWCSENAGFIPFYLERTGADGFLVGGNWWLLVETANYGTTTFQDVLGGEILSLNLCFDL